MKTIHFSLIGVCAFFTLIMIGCNSGQKLPEGMPPLKPCELTFTQEGTPLQGAIVSLYPTSGGSQQWILGGKTDTAGKAVIFTNGKYTGAPEGSYKVVISKKESEESKFGPPLTSDDPGYDEWIQKVSSEQLSTFSFVEKQYTDVRTTTLEVSVPGDAVTFDVGKAVKVKL